MKPVISYYGGKQRMAHNILPLIPQHTVYVEPFCGGATILFKKPWPKVANTDHYREVINDTDSRLINFYQQLRDNGNELVRLLQLTPYSKEEHYNSLRDGLLCEDKLEAARRYFTNSQQGFSSKLNSGWGRGVFGRNNSATWANKIADLPDYLNRMASVTIECTDAIDCIKKWDSPQSFFYCDPPYPGADQGHYKGYTEDDLKELIYTLNDCQGSFLLSMYDCEVAIPNDWERFEFAAYCACSGKGKVGADRSRKATTDELGDRKRTEAVYRRFNRVPVREEIQKLYDSGAFDCYVKR